MKTTLLGAIVAGAFALTGPAAADCAGKSFTTLSESGYFYVVNNDASAAATSASIVGRFWQPGSYATTGEQGCDESHWLPACSGCGGGPSGRTWYIDGTLGQMGCTSGCPSGEMVLTLEDKSTDHGFFLASRVTETPGFTAFDFSRIGRNLAFVPIPKPVMLASTAGEVFTASFFIPDPGGGFYGLPGVPASGTITAFWLYSSVGLPPPDRSSWSYVGRYPYSGGSTQGIATLVCPSNGILRIAAAIEFDSGQVVTTYVSGATTVECDPYQPGAGAVRDGGPDGLFVRREPIGDLTLSWGPSCLQSDPSSFEIYEGRLGDWTSHTPRDCQVLARAKTISPPPFDAYYLIVPDDDTYEGSYGKRSDGTERPLGAAVCRQRIPNACPP